jgi:hypothetical protein
MRKGNVKPDIAYQIALECVDSIALRTLYCSQANTQPMAMEEALSLGPGKVFLMDQFSSLQSEILQRNSLAYQNDLNTTGILKGVRSCSLKPKEKEIRCQAGRGQLSSWRPSMLVPASTVAQGEGQP